MGHASAWRDALLHAKGGRFAPIRSLSLSLSPPLLLFSHSSPHTPPHPRHLLAIQRHSADALWHSQVVSPNTRLSSICLVWKGIGILMGLLHNYSWTTISQKKSPRKPISPGKHFPEKCVSRKIFQKISRKNPANWENNLAGFFVLMKLGFWPGK